MPIAALVGMLLPLLPSVIKGVESIFGKGTGPQKLESVKDIAVQVVTLLQKAGKLPAGTVEPHAIESIIETLVQGMNASGQMTGVPEATGTGPIPASLPAPKVLATSVHLNFENGLLVSLG